MDYYSFPISTTFTAGNISTVINIPVTIDNIAELSEKFQISFSISPSVNDYVIPGNIKTAIGIITDNTGKIINYNIVKWSYILSGVSVTFSQSTYSVYEDGGVVQPVLIFSNPSSIHLTIQVNANARTATGTLIDWSTCNCKHIISK